MLYNTTRNMKPIALLSSMPFESELILSQLKNVRRIKIAEKTVYQGSLSALDVTLMNTGIGKVNAAHSATVIFEHFPIRFIINSGIGGAYPQSGLTVGDIALATKEIYGDEGILQSKGYSGIEKIGIPFVQRGRKKYFNEFPLDITFFRKAVKSFEHALHTPQIQSGTFITVSSVSGTIKRAIELEKRFKAVCENMEGAAIAHICTIYNIPMLEIRGISNVAGVRDKRTWDVERASENCQNAVLKVISFLSEKN